MGNRHRLDLQFTHAKAVLTIETALFKTPVTTTGTGRSMRQVDRYLELARERGNATTVIGVLMGDQDGIELLWLNTQTLQAPGGFSQGKPAVDHYQRIAGADQGRIALAT